MTREEARIELCVAQADIWYRPSDDAIDMAIEALEQVTSYENTIVKLTQAISEQEPKTGHWIKKGNTLTCPICGAVGEDIKSDYCFNYCPCCGAKMESEGK